MNRHPQVLARQVATLADLAPGRVELGIGIGGHPAEHHAYGIDWPEPAERAARLEEAVGVLRALFGGGPVTRPSPYYPLTDAHAFPAPSPVPRIVIAGEKPAGTRIAARLGDAWTCSADGFDTLYPVYIDTLAAAGRRREEVQVLLAMDLTADDPATDPILADLPGTAAAWAERGVDELVLHWIRPHQLEAVIAAAERAELRAG
jgi:alkanesulfonate monooxygenase SsuD/methylene tetrahydromethanopterin reductase-like flavin-dependent oxidoreductase (luciferase family)